MVLTKSTHILFLLQLQCKYYCCRCVLCWICWPRLVQLYYSSSFIFVASIHFNRKFRLINSSLWQQNHWCWSSALHTQTASGCCSQKATRFVRLSFPEEEKWNRREEREIEMDSWCFHSALGKFLVFILSYYFISPFVSLHPCTGIFRGVVSPSNLDLAVHMRMWHSRWAERVFTGRKACSVLFHVLFPHWSYDWCDPSQLLMIWYLDNFCIQLPVDRLMHLRFQTVWPVEA